MKDDDQRKSIRQRHQPGPDRKLRKRNRLNLDLACHLWQLFRTVISGVMYEIKEKLGCSANAVLQTIDERIHDFLVRSLQLDVFTLRA